MTINEIESWARIVIERVLNGRPSEDALVEIKSDWPPDSRDCARRIAGMANAAQGQPALLLIGVDEKGSKLVGASQVEFASWWNQVASNFDSSAPHIREHAFSPDNVHTVYAIQIDTEAAPFVVKTGLGGQISHEVPWRAATGIRTARRGDLLKLLMPRRELPRFEPERVLVTTDSNDLAKIDARIFVDPVPGHNAYIRANHMNARIAAGPLSGSFKDLHVKFEGYKRLDICAIKEPGFLLITGKEARVTYVTPVSENQAVEVYLSIILGIGQQTDLTFTLPRIAALDGERLRWGIGPDLSRRAPMIQVG